MILQSTWGSRGALVMLNLDTGKVSQCDKGDDITTYTPLATDGHNRVVAISSSLVSPPQLLFGLLSTAKNEPSLEWHDLKSWTYRFEEGRHCKPNLPF